MLLKAPMHDMSAMSHLCWPKVVHETEQASRGLQLQVKPNIPVELTMGKWSRANSRATSMLLAAIEDDLCTEMLYRRTCDSAGILYRLMTLHAPGGESENTLTLNKLQDPTRCTDAQSAAEELRAWEPWKNRAQTLGLLTPDPTILVKAVAGITAGVFDKGQNSEMAFRVSLVRSLVQVDSKPTMDTVMQFHNHLLGEMEQLPSPSPIRKGVVASSPSGGTGLTPNLKAKSLQAQGQDPNEKPPKAKTPCMFFGKRDTGCSRGRKCPY